MRKIILLIAVCFLGSCNQKDWYEKKPNVTYIISGDDTIVVTGHYNTESRHAALSGHNDTITDIVTIKFTNSFKKDTVYIHDTIIKTKEVEVGNGVFFKPDSNKDSIEEIIITPTSKL